MPVKRMMFTLAMLIAVPGQAEEAPDMEMLEYLGNWETVSGEYLDPMELKAEDVQQESKETDTQ